MQLRLKVTFGAQSTAYDVAHADLANQAMANLPLDIVGNVPSLLKGYSMHALQSMLALP